MQSVFQEREPQAQTTVPTTPPVMPALFPPRDTLNGRNTLTRQFRIMTIYAGLYALSLVILLAATGAAARVFAMGLLMPGAGFITVSHPAGVWLAVAIAALFALSLAAWFGTGNVIAPVFIWVTSLFAAPAWVILASITTIAHPWSGPALAFIPPVAFAAAFIARTGIKHHGLKRRARLNAALSSSSPSVQPQQPASELSPEDLSRIRLLLDRALQPIDQFKGFEWIDQFQTSAVRYQLNFLSYALSIVQAEHMPAFKGYLHTAQDNLAAKQQDRRIWQYWKLENMWGNLRTSADPIARDNIMYSGFVAAQLAYRNSAVSYPLTDANRGLDCVSQKGERFHYTMDDLIEVLRAQYESASYGLLACEPNWVYPLCNAITASAIRAHDASAWDDIAPAFRDALETDFITPGGQFVPFRSSYTGMAPPMVGGAVMQAFPCYFLNTVLPDVAQRQWACLQADMKGKDWRRALWPVDVGNYGFSRASSYAATAAAAREMGDHTTVDHLLALLDEDCPAQTEGGVTHRPKASLWAHANEVLARCGTQSSLQRIAAQPASPPAGANLYLKDAAYPDILVAKAVASHGQLELVLYPGHLPSFKSITIAGASPSTRYSLVSDRQHIFESDAKGEAKLNIAVRGRTQLRISPAQ